MQHCLMAVDLGTSFIKAGVYTRQGKCVSVTREEITAEKAENGSYIQRGVRILEGTLRCIKNCVVTFPGRPGQIEAVAFTGQMAGFMGIDERWNDITSWSCSLDTRYLPYAQKLTEEHRDVIEEKSGTCAPLMLPKIQWFCNEFPCEAQKVSKYIMISGYILGKMGECDIDQAVIDDSLIGWTGLGDIRKRDWSDELCARFGIDRRKLARVTAPDTICGHLSAEMAAQTGLLQGTPLIIGAGDKVAGCVGSDISRPGDMVFEAASYGGFSCRVPEYRKSRREGYYDGICCMEGMLAHKYIPGSGITLNWFLEELSGLRGKNRFEEMDKKAAVVEAGCSGLMAIGLLGGSAMPFDSEIKGMWMGFDWSHHQEHFYRSLLESYTFDLALTIDSIEESYPEIKGGQIVMTGGGAHSGLWAQMIADVTGKRVLRRSAGDASLWGTVRIAQRALGIKDPKRQSGLETEICHEPDPAMQSRYRPLKNRYENYRLELHNYFKGL